MGNFRLGAGIKATSRIFGLMAQAAALAMALLLAVSVISRYWFHYPIPGVVELVEIMLVWVVFLLLAETTFNQKHIVVGVFSSHLPSHIVTAYTFVIWVIVLTLMTWQSAVATAYTQRSGETTEMLHIPIYITQMTMTLGLFSACVMAAMRLAHSLVTLSRRRK